MDLSKLTPVLSKAVPRGEVNTKPFQWISINKPALADSVSIQFGAKAKKVTQAQANEMVNKASGTFSKKMLTAMADTATTKNSVISPANTFLLLNILNAGATGSTQQEIAKVMGLEGKASKDQVVDGLKTYVGEFAKLMEETGITLQQSFGIWAKQPLKWHPNFTQRMDVLGTEKAHLEGGAQQINDWAAKKTNDKIKTIVSEQDMKDAVSVLASATYLLSNWRKPFKEAATTVKPFNGLKGVTNVKMMTQTTGLVFDQSNPNYDMVRLPYGKKSPSGNELSMSMFLPKGEQTLKTVYNELFANGGIDTALETLNQGYANQLKLTMPKFVVETETDTGKMLQGLNMKLAFSDAAQFEELMQNMPTKISKMKQKAFIDVNEKGTEAAAVDVAVMIRATAFRPELPAEMTFDRPFVGVIHDNKGRILFANTVTDLPEADK